MWLCIDRLVRKEAKTLTFIPILDSKHQPSSSLFAVTLGCPSCLISLLALICNYISIMLPPPVHRISAQNLHDTSIREAIRRKRLPSHPPICTEGQAKVFSSPLLLTDKINWRIPLEDRKTLEISLSIFCLHVGLRLLPSSLVSFFEAEPFPGLVFSFIIPSVLTLSYFCHLLILFALNL